MIKNGFVCDKCLQLNWDCKCPSTESDHVMCEETTNDELDNDALESLKSELASQQQTNRCVLEENNHLRSESKEAEDKVRHLEVRLNMMLDLYLAQTALITSLFNGADTDTETSAIDQTAL